MNDLERVEGKLAKLKDAINKLNERYPGMLDIYHSVAFGEESDEIELLINSHDKNKCVEYSESITDDDSDDEAVDYECTRLSDEIANYSFVNGWHDPKLVRLCKLLQDYLKVNSLRSVIVKIDEYNIEIEDKSKK